jgi:hypothetical protein
MMRTLATGQGFALAALLVSLSGSPVFGQVSPHWTEHDLWRLSEPQRAVLRAQIDAERELSVFQQIFVEHGIAILRELRTLERRPEGPLDGWAQLLRAKYGHLARRGVDLVLQVGTSRPAGMSADEVEVRRGGVQKLLTRLAITGRISRAEYESFVRELQGR